MNQKNNENSGEIKSENSPKLLKKKKFVLKSVKNRAAIILNFKNIKLKEDGPMQNKLNL